MEGAHALARDLLAPRLLAGGEVTAQTFGARVADILGHRMAKAALETAVLAEYLGATRIRDCGVSVGIATSLEALLEEVTEYVDQGYRRIKLKIEPGWKPVAAVRAEFGTELLPQVDANTAYDAMTMGRLEQLDSYGLLLIEQPFEEEDLHQHAVLAQRIRTPVCPDESVTSAKAAVDAVRRGACSIVNIKAGRVGGYIEAARLHDVCVAMGVPVWCGGMLETSLGRPANVALAALPNFRLPGDTSASDRYDVEDITDPFVLEGGTLGVPTCPGIAGPLNTDLVRRLTTRVEMVR